MEPIFVYTVQTGDPNSDTCYFIAAYDALHALTIWRALEADDVYHPTIEMLSVDDQRGHMISLDEAEAPVCSIRVAMAAFVTEPCVIACSDW